MFVPFLTSTFFQTKKLSRRLFYEFALPLFIYIGIHEAKRTKLKLIKSLTPNFIICQNKFINFHLDGFDSFTTDHDKLLRTFAEFRTKVSRLKLPIREHLKSKWF